MKITKKSLENIIKEEVAHVLKKEIISEASPLLSAIAKGMAGEALYSTLVDAFLKRKPEPGKIKDAIEKLTQSRLILKVISQQEKRIKALEEVVENMEMNIGIENGPVAPDRKNIDTDVVASK